ncbi:hypothetical protein RB4206 [Rhodopirellula baltica SH 1]|uniref:Uncharacterized protein n=1 Tax=Rhodopirellula baltica (strain DSM 10527 / NCIMB 13988 / SH1) TaxID=243090 RepID=Q7UT00_RHOBA|nr:hypothetical protein RB4206 [Rhodopirellula baltica SH 1]
MSWRRPPFPRRVMSPAAFVGYGDAVPDSISWFDVGCSGKLYSRKIESELGSLNRKLASKWANCFNFSCSALVASNFPQLSQTRFADSSRFKSAMGI